MFQLQASLPTLLSPAHLCRFLQKGGVTFLVGDESVQNVGGTATALSEEVVVWFVHLEVHGTLTLEDVGWGYDMVNEMMVWSTQMVLVSYCCLFAF